MAEPAENQEVEEEVEESSLRDDLEELYVETPDDELEEEVEGKKEDAAEEPDEPVRTKKADTSDTEEAEGTEEAAKGAEGKAEAPEVAAPISFSPEARERWKDVPAPVKAEIQRREKEIADAVANTGEYRRTHQALDNLSKSYAAVMAAEGVSTPMEAVEGLFRTVAELRLGNPAQRAVKMAQLINHYGIDIESLDKALAGEAVDPELSKFEKLLDQRLGPIQQRLEGGGPPTQQQADAVQQELQQFAQNAEFLNDVKDDMADLIELKARRGVLLSFEDAYKMACANNPQISKILADREAQKSLVQQEEERKRKQAASSSIPASSSPGSPQGGPQDTLRGEIEEAWNQFSE